MATVGAVYCVYDACFLMNESVERIYPLVDKILFLLNFRPWCGDPVEGALSRTYRMIRQMPDPNNKFEIVSQYWADEKDQRNAGLKILRDQGIGWCLIIDDDEFYNRSELESFFTHLDSAIHAAYLFHHQIYWKNRETIIEGSFGAFTFYQPPSIARTNGLVKFNENRMIVVNSGSTWFNVSAENIVCHHLSYIRSHEDMLKKVSTFSHADDLSDGWFDRVWVNWHEGMTDLHPTTPPAFKRTVPAAKSAYRLEEI